jgi:hypothetical protein
VKEGLRMASCESSIGNEDCNNCHAYKGFCEYVDKKMQKQWLKSLRQANKNRKRLGTDLPNQLDYSSETMIPAL